MLDVVQSEIQVDQIPEFFTQPGIEPPQAVFGIPPVLGDPMNIGRSVQDFANRGGIPDRDGISDQKNFRKAGSIFDREVGGMAGLSAR